MLRRPRARRRRTAARACGPRSVPTVQPPARRAGLRGGPASFGLACEAIDDGIEVRPLALVLSLRRHGRRRGIQVDVELAQRSQEQPDLGAGLAMFDVDDPLPAHADALGERLLVELQLPAALADA